MESQGSICFICYCEYGQGNRLPRIIPDCGHTLCSNCLSDLLQKPQPRCPLDNMSFPLNKKSIDDYKVNFSLKHLIDEKNEGTCPHHQEKLRLYCYTDKVQICDDCALFGEHVGHKVEPIKQVRPKIEKNKKNVEEALKVLEKHDEKIENILKKSEAKFIKTVRDRFEQLRWVTASKEAELITRVSSFFTAQGSQIKQYLGTNSCLKNDLFKKLSNFNNLLASEDIFSLLEENASFITSKYNTEVFEKYTRSLDQSFKGIFESFDDLLSQQIIKISEIDLPVTTLSEKVSAYLKSNEQNTSEEERQQALMYQAKTIFEVRKHDDILEIIAGDKEPEDIKININELRTSSHIKFSLNKYILTDEDMNTLFYIWTNISSIFHLEIWCNPKGIFNNVLLSVFPLIFWKTKDLSALKVDLSQCNIGDESSIFFMNRILPKLTSLKSLSLNFCNTSITNETVKVFAQSNLDIIKSLTTIELDFERTKVTNDSVTELFVPMPNLQDLNLNLMFTSIGDRSVEMFIKHTLSTIKNLQKLKLLLGQTHITDQGLSQLFKNLKSLKEFVLGLGNTKVTHKTLSLMGKEGLSTMKDLEVLDLRLSYNNEVNDENMMTLWAAMESLSLKRLSMSFFQTEIGDVGLEGLAECLSSYRGSLDSFELWLCNPKVTDKGILALLGSLPNLSELNLKLANIRMTDKAGQELVDTVLPRMKKLKKLDVKVSNTQVSGRILGQLAEIKSRLANKSFKKVN